MIEGRQTPEECLGVIIKETRINNALSQEGLSKITGLDRSYLSQVETGKKSPSFSTLLKISTGLDIKLSTLIFKFEDQFPNNRW